MNKKHMIIAYIVMAVLLVTLIAAGIFIVLTKQQNDSELGSLGNELNDLRDEGEAKNDTIDSLNTEKADLEKKIAELNEQLSRLKDESEQSSSEYEAEIEKLKDELEEKQREIDALNAELDKYKTVYSIDISEQAKLIDELTEYIETECPYVRMPDEVTTDENGNEVIVSYKWVEVSELEADEAAQSGKISDSSASGTSSSDEDERPAWLSRDDVYYPNIAVYYEDLTSGYRWGYNEDLVFDSASVIKAPYILSVLEVISKDEQDYLDRLEAQNLEPEMIDTDGDGTPDSIKYEYSDPSYDLSEVVVYDSATMYQSGSGKIQEMEDGTEFTYIDFIKYTLEYSDNIAYRQLRNRFGFNTMYSLAQRVGAQSVLNNGRNMTAEDAGKLFGEIWKFTETDEKYGSLMKNSMLKGNHTVIIPSGVSPTPAMHKYGWDTNAYHDVAIVLDGEHPYIIAVFSDLDIGGDEVNAFLRGIVKQVKTLHSNFYK